MSVMFRVLADLHKSNGKLKDTLDYAPPSIKFKKKMLCPGEKTIECFLDDVYVGVGIFLHFRLPPPPTNASTSFFVVYCFLSSSKGFTSTILIREEYDRNDMHSKSII